MKKNISILLLSLFMVACSNNEERLEEVSPQAKAIYTYEDNLPRVTLKEEASDIVFESYANGELQIAIELVQGQEVERILISDGNKVLRIKDIDDKFTLDGDTLIAFKSMVEEGSNIKLKGKISSYEYFSQDISKEDVEIIKLMF